MQRSALCLLSALSVLVPSSGVALAQTAQPSQAEGAKAPAAPAGELSAGELADRVQAFYDKTKTFKAAFKQRYWIDAYRKSVDSNGQVVFAKPGKMSWRYESNGNRVVSDGKIIKVYEKEDKQMYEQSMEKSQYPAALAFLLGGGKLRKEFHLQKLDPKSVGYEGGFVLLGLPKEPTPAYQKMILYVDSRTFQVRRVLLIDAQRNRNRFDFVQPVVNEKVPAGEFEFRPPPGTQIIRP